MLILYLMASGMVAFCLLACYMDRPERRQSGPDEFGWYGVLGAAVLMAVPIVAMLSGLRYPFMNMVWGDFFARKFDYQFDVGWVLDQPTLHKYFFWFTVIAVSTLPFVIAARWLSDRRTHIGYWIPVIGTVIVALCLLTFLVIPSYMLYQYIGTLGFTPMRAVAVLYTAGCIIASVAGITWVAWTPSSDRELHDLGK